MSTEGGATAALRARFRSWVRNLGSAFRRAFAWGSWRDPSSGIASSRRSVVRLPGLAVEMRTRPVVPDGLSTLLRVLRREGIRR